MFLVGLKNEENRVSRNRATETYVEQTKDQMLLARRADTSVRRLCVHDEITAHRKICLASRTSEDVPRHGVERRRGLSPHHRSGEQSWQLEVSERCPLARSQEPRSLAQQRGLSPRRD